MASREGMWGALLPGSRGELARLLEASPPDPAAAARLLDGMAHAERLRVTRGLGPRAQARLYEWVQGFAKVTLDGLVPPDVPELVPVRYYGRNSLPAFKLFEKRFYRTRTGRLAGANFSPTAVVVGPGYFCMREDPAHGEVAIDYTQVPSEEDGAPRGWPAIRDNDHGAAKLVFGGMIDTLRRVSKHVLIGAAARHGKPLGAHFVLCRQPEP